MKRFFNIAACLSLLLLANSCKLDEIDSQMTDEEAIASIRLECDALEAYTIQAEKPQAVSFSVTSTTPWTVTCSGNPDWLTVTPSSSAESSLAEDIVIKAKANSTYSDRSTVVTIQGENTSITHQVTITQLRKGMLSVTPLTESFLPLDSPKTFTVSCNIAWNATVADDWLTLSPASGSSDGATETFTVTATAETNSSVTRTTTVTVTAGDAKETFNVIQRGQTLEILPVADPAVDRRGAELLLDVDATIDWKVECDDPTVTATREGNDKIRVKVPFNNKFLPRTIKVTIRPVSASFGDVSSSVELTQDINFVLSGDCEILQDGSVMVIGDDRSRITTIDAFRYVSINVVLGDKNIESAAQMCLSTHDAGDAAEYQCQILLGSKTRLRSNGTATNYNTAAMDITQSDLSAIQTYRMDFVPNEGQIKLEYFYNGVSRQSMTSVSVFEGNPEAAGHYFFGYETAGTDDTWYVVKSIDVTPIAE